MAARNLSNLRTELRARLKQTGTGLSSPRIDDWLNDAQDDVTDEFNFSHLSATETISTVANTNLYYLKFDYNKIQSVLDTTNDLELVETTEYEVEANDPDLSESASPTHWYTRGWARVRGQLSSADTIRVVSNSSADTSQRILVNGIVNGVEDFERLSLNGTSNVDGSSSFTQIHSIYKDAVTDGVVTVSAISAGTTLALFGKNNLVDENMPLYLWPNPSGVVSLRIRGYKKPRKLVSDEDMPDMPSRFHDLVLTRAVIIGHRDLMRPELATDLDVKEYKPGVERLRRHEGSKPGRRSPVIIGEPSLEIRRIGRLPSNFPII